MSSHSVLTNGHDYGQGPPKKTPKLSTSTEPLNIIDIVPTGPPGDIVIQIKLPVTPSLTGSMATSRPSLIRVHSLILTLVSPYFAELLSKSNVEDKYTATSPLQLPDDFDGAAFLDWVLMICNQAEALQKNASVGPAVNARSPSSQHNPTEKGKNTRQPYMGRFPRVVALARRLGCAGSMKSWCAMPLWRFFGPRGEADEDGLGEAGLSVLDAIAIAYVVGDNTLFKRATEYALVHFTYEQMEEEIGGGLASALPKALMANIKNHRRQVLNSLEHGANKPITAIYKQLLDPDDPEDNPIEPCELATEKLATFTLQMCHLKRGGLSLAGGKGSRSVADVWEGLETMVDILPKSNKKCGKNCEGGCTIDIREGVRQAVEESKQGIRGVCLECVAEGRAGVPRDYNGNGEDGAGLGSVEVEGDEVGGGRCVHGDLV